MRSGERSYLGTVVLPPGAPVSGQVVDSSGQGVSAADVDGSFRLPGVPHEPGLLSASLLGSTGHRVLEAGEARDVRIVIPDGPRTVPRRFAGIVVGPDGIPLPGAQVTLLGQPLEGQIDLSSQLPWNFGSEWADGEGRFEVFAEELDQMFVFQLTLRASDPEQRYSFGEVPDVQPNGEDIVVRLTPPKWVEVRLIDSSGDVVPWGHVKSVDRPCAAGSWPKAVLSRAHALPSPPPHSLRGSSHAHAA